MEELSVTVLKDLVRILKVKDEDIPRLVRLYLAIELYREGKAQEKLLRSLELRNGR